MREPKRSTVEHAPTEFADIPADLWNDPAMVHLRELTPEQDRIYDELAALDHAEEAARTAKGSSTPRA